MVGVGGVTSQRAPSVECAAILSVFSVESAAIFSNQNTIYCCYFKVVHILPGNSILPLTSK